MARRKRSLNLEISLFAFQDIIISVTGVLILIILLLVLEITISVNTDGLQKLFAASAAELKEDLKEIDAEINVVSSELETSRKLVNQATLNPESVLEEKMAHENSAIDDLKKNISHLDSRAERISKEEQDQERKQKSMRLLKEKHAALVLRKKQLENEIASMSKGDTAHYLAPNGVQPQKAWLCDVSGDGLELVVMDGTGAKTILKRKQSKSVSLELFKDLNRWLQKQNPTPEYILFVIRPSGADFSDILGLKGDQLNAGIGVEFVTEDHITLNKNN